MAVGILCMVLPILAATNLAAGTVINACYGTDPRCDFYDISCPDSNIIRFNNVYAGYKSAPVCQSVTDHCANADTCCTFQTTDALEELTVENRYNTYANCSARQSCLRVHAPWQLMAHSVTSTYVQMEYDCEPVADKVPMCGSSAGPITIRGMSIDILFDGSVEAFSIDRASKVCTCSVSNSFGPGQELIFSVVDIRMESHYKPDGVQAAECSSAQFSSQVFGASCINTTKHYRHNFYYGIQISLPLAEDGMTEMMLYDLYQKGARDAPSLVWINLRSNVRDFSVKCEEVLPADLTTTTTRAPPTTTTTKTTSKTTTTTTRPPTTTTRTTTQAPRTTTTTRAPQTTTKTTTKSTTTVKPTTTPFVPTTQRPTTRRTTTTTTTRAPPTTTTTTKAITTVKPTTTSKKTTLVAPTTQRPATTTTSSTTKRTTRIPITVAPTSEETTASTTTEAAEGAGNVGGGSKTDAHRRAVYIAIFVPIAVGLIIILCFLLWVYWKRTAPKSKKFNMRKYIPGSDPYMTLTDEKILDKYLIQNGIRPKPPSVLGDQVKVQHHVRPVVSGSNIRPPSVSAEDYQNRISEKYVPMNTSPPPGEKLPIQPYTIPINVTKHNPLYTFQPKPAKQQQQQPQQPQHSPVVYHVKLGKDTRPDTDKPDHPDIIQDNKSNNVVKLPDVYKADKDPPNKVGEPLKNGGVVIHIDNISNPPSSARTDKSAPSTSSQSFAESPTAINDPSLDDKDEALDAEIHDTSSVASDVESSEKNRQESAGLVRF